ncbi:sulfatase family protein [Albibacterium bauzanense]|uniref:Arylsulfatase n=1 Tax=Albibacterium bauzanense TaxID=653929 RepID=A0A4R1LV62_9SPHI|nr:sulfatase [Albibacterium bauzanense]TCK83276.1 arylsulfatase [Albibacterium bauzanense]
MKKWYILLVGICLLTIHVTAQVPQKPNVIIIMMDDMGYGDIEPYGMTGIPTPNFNRMAKEGTRFTHYNAAQAVCTASRASLLTGSYPNRVGMSGALLPGSKTALNPEEETIASLLKASGYITGMLGKWHLGNEAPYFPLSYGFDSFYGIPYSHDIWPIDYDGNRITDPNNMRGKWPALPVIEGNKKVDSILTLQQASLLTRTFTEKAVSFIKENKNNPFFLYLAHPMPHVPLVASDKFSGKSEMGVFGDVIMELDWSIGEVLSTLDEEKIADNTILIVISDNGPWLNFGDNAGSSGGFKEGKSTSWEGGTRVPFLIRWPDKIEGGTVNSSLMTNMDLLPTLAKATGSSLPKNKIDGLNFLPLWLHETNKGPREVFYYYFGKNNLEGVRYKNWKLVLPHPSGSYTALHGKAGHPGVISRVNVPLALYDLAHDPGEAYDVQQLYPEIVQKLIGLAEDARVDLGDDLTQRVGNNIRKAAILP